MNEFIWTEEEVINILTHAIAAGRSDCIRESKELPEYYFFNITGIEERVDFPTMYWPKTLHVQVRERLAEEGIV